VMRYVLGLNAYTSSKQYRDDVAMEVDARLADAGRGFVAGRAPAPAPRRASDPPEPPSQLSPPCTNISSPCAQATWSAAHSAWHSQMGASQSMHTQGAPLHACERTTASRRNCATTTELPPLARTEAEHGHRVGSQRPFCSAEYNHVVPNDDRRVTWRRHTHTRTARPA